MPINKFIMLSIGLLLYSGPLIQGTEARELRVSILPFSITGNPQAAGFATENLSEKLASASQFLLSQVRETQFSSRTDIIQAVSRANWNASLPFDQRNLQKYCNFSSDMFLISGHAYFSPGRIDFEIQSWSCHVQSQIGQAQSSGTPIELQARLEQALRKSTPYLNPRQKSNLIKKHQISQDMDLAVIVDTSGSMQTDLPEIHKALLALEHSSSESSRLGLIFLNDQNRQNIIPFDKNWSASLRYFQQNPPTGQTTMAGLQAALQTVLRYNAWQAPRHLAIFTDVSLGGQRQSTLESYLRQIKSQGIQLHLFELLNQAYNDRKEWQRMARALQSDFKTVWYGRKLYPLEGQPYWLISGQQQFYTTSHRDSLAADIQKNTLNPNQMVRIISASFEASELNLSDLSTAWPKRKNQRILDVGPIVSSLQKSIAQQLQKKREGSANNSRRNVLLKNGAHSFWIHVANERLLQEMQKRKRFFIGVHLSSAKNERLRVLPQPIYLRGYSSVPRLFITTWERLNRVSVSSIRPGDVWFLEVSLIETR